MNSKGIHPECVLVPESRRYSRKALRRLSFDGETLTVEIQGEGLAFARVVFRGVVGFRVLDDRDLCEFWNRFSEPNGWLWEVRSGGWGDLERTRPSFNSHELVQGLREFLIADNTCVSVLCTATPEIVDFGTAPPM